MITNSYQYDDKGQLIKAKDTAPAIKDNSFKSTNKVDTPATGFGGTGLNSGSGAFEVPNSSVNNFASQVANTGDNRSQIIRDSSSIGNDYSTEASDYRQNNSGNVTVGSIASAATPAIQQGMSAINQASQTNITPEVEQYTKKDQTKDAAVDIGTTLASAGATAALVGGPVGMISGGITAAIGLALGFISRGKKKKQAKENKAINTQARTQQAESRAREDMNQQEQSAAQEVARRARDNNNNQTNSTNAPAYGTAGYEKGGTIGYSEHLLKSAKKKSFVRSNSRTAENLNTIFRSGGQIKEVHNIIPNGVLHADTNSFGDGGMPIVQCDDDMQSCTKKFEIEKDELIFTKKTTDKTNTLVKQKKYKELGGFLKDQLLNNTHSFTKKFKELN